MKIWIRADGNGQIATGHLRRTLSIAQALRERGCGVHYLLADEESRQVLLDMAGEDRSSWSCQSLGVPYGRPMEELGAIRMLTQKERPDWFLVDSYAVTEEYLRQLRAVCPGSRVAYLDDLLRFDPDADMVINYAPDEDNLCRFYRRAAVCLLGARYAPLRRQFAGLTPVVRQEAGTVLISTGGTDPYGMADLLAERIQPFVRRIRFLAPGHGTVEQVAPLMQSCDLAVSAGGTTLYELCAAGVPAIAFSMAGNQRIFARRMAEAGACRYAGDVRDEEERGRVAETIRLWIAERTEPGPRALSLRRAESGRMHALTDGRGAEAIAQALLCTDRHI